MNGNYGFTFHGIFIDLPGGGSSDALLRFTATLDLFAQQAGWSISDAHLFIEWRCRRSELHFHRG